MQLLQQSLRGAGNLIPRATAYHRMVTLTMTLGEDYRPVLREALEAFPDDFNLKAVLAVTRSLSEDDSTRQQGIRSIAALGREADQRQFEHAMAVIHHNLGHRYRVLNRYELAAQAFVHDGKLQRAVEVCDLGLMTQPTAELYLLLDRIRRDLGDEAGASAAHQKAATFR